MSNFAATHYVSFSLVGMYGFGSTPDSEVDSSGGFVSMEGTRTFHVRFADNPKGEVTLLGNVVRASDSGRHIFLLALDCIGDFVFPGSKWGEAREDLSDLQEIFTERDCRKMIFCMPPPSAYQANEATITPCHIPQRAIDVNRLHYSYGHQHDSTTCVISPFNWGWGWPASLSHVLGV